MIDEFGRVDVGPGVAVSAGLQSRRIQAHPASRALDPVQPWLDGMAMLLTIVLGGACVAVAYALGRSHTWGASGVFWVGQGLIFLPSGAYILSRRGPAGTHLAILVAIAGIQAALVWAYSPDVFRFPDELQHLRSAHDILATHKLGAANPTLPVSPGFPGLEEMTTALSNMSGLSLYVSGRIVASVSHMLVPVFLWGAFRAWSGSDRIAGAAVLMYTTDPHFAYFDVLWAYGTPGITFLALLFRNVMISVRERSSELPIALAFVPLLLSHHLATLAGLLLLVAVTACLYLGGERRTAGGLVRLTVLLALLAFGYVVLITPATVKYLAQPLISNIDAALALHSAGAAQGVLKVAPAWEPLAEALGVLVTLGVAAIGICLLWFHDVRRSLKLLSLGAISYLVVLAIRVAAPDGAELSSRALTFAMMLIAFPMSVAFVGWSRVRVRRVGTRSAVALARLQRTRLRRIGVPVAFGFSRAAGVRLPRRVGTLVALTTFGLLVVTTIVAAQPPAWERIPGRFYPGGQESGVDARTATLDRWVSGRGWGPKTDVACDVMACAEIGAWSNADPSTDSSKMYATRSITKLNLQISKITVDYVQTDLRWTREVPPTGTYFAEDPVQHVRPLPTWVITRFDRDPLVDRVYDDGDNRIYDTYWVWHQ